MRPNSRGQQRLVRTLRGFTTYVYAVPAGLFPKVLEASYLYSFKTCIGTVLPDDLILVHEFADHYSLQPRKEMTVDGENRPLISK